jgi:hypothetical protein
VLDQERRQNLELEEKERKFNWEKLRLELVEQERELKTKLEILKVDQVCCL